MKYISHYTKVITLGSTYTENALIGEVILQEKVDGSQFRFGLNENNELQIASKNALLISPQVGMFKEGVDYILSVESKIKQMFNIDTIFFGEYLQRPKHNVLKYSRIPKNHIILFDVIKNCKFVERNELKEIAEYLDIDFIPTLYHGIVKDTDVLKQILENTQSYLGGELIEGIVIKNYNQTILLGNNIFPLFTKFVRESFKEQHKLEWKSQSSKGQIEEFIKSFHNEARWQKSILHLKEQNLIENSPRDIGKIIKEIQEDIKMEESENIKKFLYNKYIFDILRKSTGGVAEWYKEKLLENVK